MIRDVNLTYNALCAKQLLQEVYWEMKQIRWDYMWLHERNIMSVALIILPSSFLLNTMHFYILHVLRTHFRSHDYKCSGHLPSLAKSIETWQPYFIFFLVHQKVNVAHYDH